MTTDQQIIDFWNSGDSARKISRDTKRSLKYVLKILHENKITPTKSKRWKQEEIDYIIKEYLAGKSTVVLEQELNITRRVIVKLLQDNNIEIHGARIHHFNEHYFDNIDTEEKAYFIGLLYADGCNSIGYCSNRVALKLQDRDVAILERYRDALAPGVPLVFRKKQKPSHRDTFCLRLNSIILSEQLNKLGCTPAKSLTLQFPTWLTDSELQRHFIRGYFDGDGCISFHLKNKNYRSYSYQLTSTVYFCEKVIDIIYRATNIAPKIRKEHIYNQDITKTLMVKGNRRVMKVMEWMYNDATVFLERKYERFLALKEHNILHHY